MSDIRTAPHHEIRAAIENVIGEIGDAQITRDSRGAATEIRFACERLTFEAFTQLAGLCMSPDMDATADLVTGGVLVTIRWRTPLAVGETIRV